jgi:phasin family protein
MFQYPGSFAYQMPSIARANLQAWLNVSGRFASGMQALTELNVQTMQKMVEESNALLRAGDEATPGDMFGWQTVMLAQFPQKAASYGQHVMSIITSTESDMIGEVRSQYERNGISMKGMMETAVQDAQNAVQSSGELATNLADSASQAAQDTSHVILDASGDVAKNARATARRAV